MAVGKAGQKGGALRLKHPATALGYGKCLLVF